MAELGRQHPIVKRLRRLRRDRCARDGESVIVAEGPTVVAEAHARGADIEFALTVAEELDSALMCTLRDAGTPIHVTARSVLDTLQDARSPRAALAVVRRPGRTVSAKPSLVVVTYGIQDPGNLGAILRTAAAAGAAECVVVGDGVDPFHPRAVRASAGALFAVTPSIVADPVAVIDALRARGLMLVGACADAGVPYDRHDWTTPTAILLGAESAGLPERVLEQLDGTVSIPMVASIESLSVGAAAAVVLFEIARQRRTINPSDG